MAGEVTRLALAALLRDYLRVSLVKEITVPAPAVGAEWSVTVPGGVLWEVLTCRMSFFASAVVATRVPTFKFRDPDTNDIFRSSSATTIAASGQATLQYVAGAGYTVTGSPAVALLPASDYALVPGCSLITQTSNMDVGDSYSAILLQVREWSDDGVYDVAERIMRRMSTIVERDRIGV